MAAYKRQKNQELHMGEAVDSMDRPNLLVPLEPCDEFPSHFFPLLQIKHEDPDTDKQQAVFFDEMHGDGWWQWYDRAPSWMDPHKFVEMALTRKRIQQCLKVCFEKNIERPAKRDMPEMLDEVMDEYLAYVLEKFEMAKPYIIAWMVRNHCYKETTPEKVDARKKAARKKASRDAAARRKAEKEAPTKKRSRRKRVSPDDAE